MILTWETKQAETRLETRKGADLMTKLCVKTMKQTKEHIRVMLWLVVCKPSNQTDPETDSRTSGSQDQGHEP